VRVKRRATAPLNVVFAFFIRRAALARSLGRLAATIHPHSGLWSGLRLVYRLRDRPQR